MIATELHLSFCTKCREWQERVGPCERCGVLMETAAVLDGELNIAFGRLVLALQGVVPYRDAGLVQLDPRMWGTDPATIVKAAVNPLFWSNRTNPETRMAINLLTGVAGQYGIQADRSTDFGEEIEITEGDGARWLMWRRRDNGTLSPIRRLDEKIEYRCQECDTIFPSEHSLRGHQMVHARKAR